MCSWWAYHATREIRDKPRDRSGTREAYWGPVFHHEGDSAVEPGDRHRHGESTDLLYHRGG